MTPAKNDQLALISLAHEFKVELAKAFGREAKLRMQYAQLSKNLERVSEKLKQKTDVRDVFDLKKFASLAPETKEAFLRDVENDSPRRSAKKSGGKRLGKADKLKMLQNAVGNRAEVKLADLKSILDVSNVNQWIAGLDLPKGSIESLGSKKAGSKLLVSKIKHLFGG